VNSSHARFLRVERVDDEWEPACVYKELGTRGSLFGTRRKYGRKKKDFGDVLAAAAKLVRRVCESRYAEDCARVRDSCWDDHVCRRCDLDHGTRECKMDSRHGALEEDSEQPAMDLAERSASHHKPDLSSPGGELGCEGKRNQGKGNFSKRRKNPRKVEIFNKIGVSYYYILVCPHCGGGHAARICPDKAKVDSLGALRPAQRLRGDHSKVPPSDSRQNYSCEICKIPQISGKISYMQHINGAKHSYQKSLLENCVENRSKSGSQNVMCTDGNEQLTQESRKYYPCKACKINKMGSEKQYIEHINGKKHKEQTKILEERTNEQKEEQVGGTADEVALENGRRIADLSIQ